MKKRFLLGIAIILLLLDWLALDDITTGDQPSYPGEYLMLLVSLIIFGAIAFIFFRKKS